MGSSIVKAMGIMVENAGSKLDLSFIERGDEKSQKKVREYLPALERAMVGGEIWNTEWTELKFWVERIFNDSIKRVSEKINDRYHAWRAKPENKDSYSSMGLYDYTSSVYLHHVPGKAKKLRSPGTKRDLLVGVPYLTDELYDDLLEIYKDFEGISVAIKDVKSKIKKGRQPNPDAKPAYVPPPASMASLKMISDEVEKVTQSMYDNLVKNYEKHFESIVDMYFARRSKDNQSPYGMRDFRDGMASLVSKFITNVKPGRSVGYSDDPYVKRPDYQERLELASKEQANIVRDRYRSKMMQKLGSIVGRKAENGVALKSVNVGHLFAASGTFEGWMKFDFDDGSSFRVQNKVISKWSSTGKPFEQYPTTFHDVKFADGEIYSMRSEEQMNTDFVDGSSKKAG